MLIFFSAGEPSGDLHGANLIRALRRRSPSAEFVGFGGPHMAEAGCRLHYDLTSMAVMGIVRVLVRLHHFLHLASIADRYFRHHRPDAVVLIDYPGFNWWIAWRAKRHGIPVFYFSPPQIWAWGAWRIKKMRRYVDHILCGLPFEETWFRQRGCNATFVGHPFFDEVRRYPVDRCFADEIASRQGPLVALLPGSRTQEIVQNLPSMLKAVELVGTQVPGVRFAIAAYKPRHAQMATQLVKAAALDVPVYVRRTFELIQASTCCLAVSGSVSLELLHHEKPTVIVYHISRFAHRVQRRFRTTRYITLVNLLATSDIFPKDITPFDPWDETHERAPFPEYLTCEDRSFRLAMHLVEWLLDERRRQATIDQLREIKARVGQPGSTARAAEYIATVLELRAHPMPRPHFLAEPLITLGGAQSHDGATARAA